MREGLHLQLQCTARFPLSKMHSITNTNKLRTNDTTKSGDGTWRSPIFRVHCGKQKQFNPLKSNPPFLIQPKSPDNTPESCAKRLEFQFPIEAMAIKSGRYRYIEYVKPLAIPQTIHFNLVLIIMNSVWRCVAGTNADAPLAVCDYRSITPTDLHRIDIVYPHFSEEGFEVMYNPAHRWYYKKGMSKDDIVLFKIDDNLEGVARCKSKF